MDKNIPRLRSERMRRILESVRHEPGEPHPRDILKREYDEAQKRPRNEALGKWGPAIEEQIMRRIRVRQKMRAHEKRGIEVEPE
jgi:hypothetical protein